jgi:hypothetical protein
MFPRSVHALLLQMQDKNNHACKADVTRLSQGMIAAANCQMSNAA